MLRKMRVTFDVDMQVFAAALAQAGAMHIDVFGDEAPIPLNGHKPPKLLAPPKSHKKKTYKPRKSSGSAPNLVLDALATAPDGTLSSAALVKVCTATGLSRAASSNALNKLKGMKCVKRIGLGMWQVTEKGRELHTTNTEGTTHD